MPVGALLLPAAVGAAAQMLWAAANPELADSATASLAPPATSSAGAPGDNSAQTFEGSDYVMIKASTILTLLTPRNHLSLITPSNIL